MSLRPRLPAAVTALARRALPVEVRLAVRRTPAIARYLVVERRARRVTSSEDCPFVLAARQSPLARPGTTYEAHVQHAKETNVRRAAGLVDGAWLPPGARFSWHARVGPPLRVRGFLPGPELRGDGMAMGTGGGACQVANLVLWLGLMSGLSVVERHRHGLDLFPDASRDVPFGCGATVLYPHKDLVLENRQPFPVQLALRVEDGFLRGEARTTRDPGVAFEIVERDHRFVREDGGIVRENRIFRRAVGPSGEARGEEFVFENRARVAYDVDESLLDTAALPGRNAA